MSRASYAQPAADGRMPRMVKGRIKGGRFARTESADVRPPAYLRADYRGPVPRPSVGPR